MSKTPMLYKEYTQAGIGNNRVYGVLLCMKYLLKNDLHWNMFVDKIEMLFDKYQNKKYCREQSAKEKEVFVYRRAVKATRDGAYRGEY